MPEKQYDLRSWIDSRVEIRPSPIAGKGMFAREPIKKDEIVIVWGGVVLSTEDIGAELQDRYRDHFSPFLNDRIKRLKAC